MKLLLDEMFTHALAEQLRARGHDVVAVTEREDLRGLEDDELLTTAHQEGLAIVTENAVDFRPIATRALRAGQAHSGLILTTHHAFPRGHPRTVGRLVTALDRLLANPPEGDSWERWLS